MKIYRSHGGDVQFILSIVITMFPVCTGAYHLVTWIWMACLLNDIPQESRNFIRGSVIIKYIASILTKGAICALFNISTQEQYLYCVHYLIKIVRSLSFGARLTMAAFFREQAQYHYLKQIMLMLPVIGGSVCSAFKETVQRFVSFVKVLSRQSFTPCAQALVWTMRYILR